MGTSTNTVFHRAIAPFHRPAPERLQRPPLLRFRRNKTGLRIDVTRQIELTAEIIPHPADEIYGVEMRRRGHQTPCCGAIWDDSAICNDLAAVGLPHPKRPAARLAFVLHHTAHPDRTIQQFAQQTDLPLRFQRSERRRQPTAQPAGNE